MMDGGHPPPSGVKEMTRLLHLCFRSQIIFITYHAYVASGREYAACRLCMHGHTYSKSMDEPGKVANPARG